MNYKKNYHFGFVAYIEEEFTYESKLALISCNKRKSAVVDAEATHHFLYSRSAFIYYVIIEIKNVKAKSGVSKLVGKG